ncbi:MAG: hypothetical protein KME55_25190 [Nostoc indistinguendum CM1-VF10]|nr:hypothetical protein [Nostoc indistinguendum CM1-VF10]
MSWFQSGILPRLDVSNSWRQAIAVILNCVKIASAHARHRHRHNTWHNF